MTLNWQAWVLWSCLLSLNLIGAQLFEQPSTLPAPNIVYSAYTSEDGATALPKQDVPQRASIKITKAVGVEVSKSEELAPFYQQLLRQTMPNWQQQQQPVQQQQQQQRVQQLPQRHQQEHQQQQQQQHSFVQLPSQQPQNLQEFNGVNVRQQQQQQRQQSLLLKQQKPSTQLPIQLQHTPYSQTPPKTAMVPTAATATKAGAEIGVMAPNGSLDNSFQPISTDAQNGTMAAPCEVCCGTAMPPNATCPCCNIFAPFLSATVLKLVTG